MKCGGCGTEKYKYLMAEEKCPECYEEPDKEFTLFEVVVLLDIILFLLVIIWL